MIYFDHAATTPIKPIALLAIETAPYGNPNSLHAVGLEAAQTLRRSEKIIKDYINGHNGRLVWLNSASLANAFVIKNAFRKPYYLPNAFVCMNTAHKSILQYGNPKTIIHSLESGLISVKELITKVTSTTRLVSMLYVNNETGVIQPIELIKEKIGQSLYHVDAVQAAGKIPIDVERIKCDFLTMSGHKFGTPKGIACLWIRSGVEIDLPYLGTPQVPLIYAFSTTLASMNLTERKTDIVLKEQFFKNKLVESASLNKVKFIFNVKTIRKLPGILSIRFPGIDASELLMRLSDKKVAVSSGSACSSKEITPSHVLTAMNLSACEALSTIRISMAPENTWKELEKGTTILTETVKEIYNERS